MSGLNEGISRLHVLHILHRDVFRVIPANSSGTSQLFVSLETTATNI